jgi:hypothetical protein
MLLTSVPTRMLAVPHEHRRGAEPSELSGDTPTRDRPADASCIDMLAPQSARMRDHAAERSSRDRTLLTRVSPWVRLAGLVDGRIARPAASGFS